MNARFTHSLVLTCLCALCIQCGCDNGKKTDTEARLRHTIERVAAVMPNNTRVLDALKKASPVSLRRADLPYVIVAESPDGTGHLLVQWIEDVPTPDAILIIGSNPSYQKTVPFDDLYNRDNLEESKELVLFHFAAVFSDPVEWAEMKTNISNGKGQAVLLRNRKEVSNRATVAFAAKKE